MNSKFDFDGFHVYAFVAVVTLIVIISTIKEQQSWEKFKVEHDCVVIEQVTGSTTYGYTTKGGSVYIDNPSKTGYKCNDGVVYWR